MLRRECCSQAVCVKCFPTLVALLKIQAKISSTPKHGGQHQCRVGRDCTSAGSVRRTGSSRSSGSDNIGCIPPTAAAWSCPSVSVPGGSPTSLASGTDGNWAYPPCGNGHSRPSAAAFANSFWMTPIRLRLIHVCDVALTLCSARNASVSSLVLR